MNRFYAVLFVAAVTGCGPKNADSLCNQVPAPAACAQACDPTPGAANTCPSGYHCSPDGMCDLQCTQGGGECPEGDTCSPDGYCNQGSNMVPDVDANCPAVHFSPTPTIPSIELVLDRSGSMGMSDISPTRYGALQTALFGAAGAVTTKEAQVYFGEELFSGDEPGCNDGPPGSLDVTNYSAPRALNNAAAMTTLTSNHPPAGNTPTAAALGQAYADFATNPPPAGSPAIVLLATDGDPNGCNGGNDNNRSPNAATAAYTSGIRTFIIGLANLNPAFLQTMANAGAGTTNAPYYTANDPSSLVTAFNTIINGVISCDLTINQAVDPASAPNATVTLDGANLTYGTDWTLDPNGMIIHIVGSACDTLKNTPNAMVDATFPCGSVIF
ncbi:MAG: vWA domain-containing protein [Kofleriaceae bacterium]